MYLLRESSICIKYKGYTLQKYEFDLFCIIFIFTYFNASFRFSSFFKVAFVLNAMGNIFDELQWSEIT